MRSSLYVATGLTGATLALAASCGFDPSGLPADTSTSAAAASGGGSAFVSSAASGSGGAGGVSASSSDGSTSGTGGSGAGGGNPGLPILVAGELLVDLDVNDPTAGTAAWSNKGSLGGDFKAMGAPKKGVNGGKSSVLFNGTSDAYLGPLSVATLEGNDDRSIELWVLNSMIAPVEETMISWSNLAPHVTGTMLSFNYGNSTGWGAVTHWNEPDLAWGLSTDPAPQGNTWHHLAYTYDGTTATVFADGAKKNSKAGTLATKAGFSINLAVQREATGFVDYGSLAIAVVRIHSGSLTAAQVKANYEAEKMRFQ